MSKPGYLSVLKQDLLGIVIFVALIWVVFILDRVLPLEQFALVPRHISGLPGVLLSPFLHKNLSHIVANSMPLLVLLGLLAGSRANSARTVFALIVVSGSLLWLFGRPVAVIGASGLVFALIGFLIASGIMEKRPLAMLVGAFVGFSYGGTLLFGVLPGQDGISWDGHLFGAVAGILVAWLFRRRIRAAR